MAIIHHLHVENFRGIKSLDWHIDSRVVCLIGPGDSTKTTILNAIELALAPRWNITFTDSDFHKTNTDQPIIIEVTVGELPEVFIKQDKFGLYLRGYSIKEKIIHDDPIDEDEKVLTIKLQVDQGLEPQWTVIKSSNPDPKPISWRDRELFAVAVLGYDMERDLTWSRGSALARLTDTSSSAQVIAIANREARKAVANMDLEAWKQIAEQAHKLAKEFGVPVSQLTPGLDVKAIRFGQGILALYDNEIPLHMFGLGSKRLAALAIQEAAIGKSSIILIDEIEHGLEPHRIRRLIKLICDGRKQGQVLLTSHSPTPVFALPIRHLNFCQCQNGEVRVLACESNSENELQAVVRSCPLAVFAKKIIVCEGKTEEALCRELNNFWTQRHDGESMELRGAVAVDGNGTPASSKATFQFAKLGYDVIYFGDSDRPLDPSEQTLKDAGVEVLLWPNSMCIEQRIAVDIPLQLLQELINTATEIKSTESVKDSIKTEITKLGGNQAKIISLNLDNWLSNGIDELIIRSCIGNAAKLSDWFKNLNEGKLLAEIVLKSLSQIPESPLFKNIKKLEDWVYAT
jgi:ABC-type branched-subunit amino acid transport system ATPase component